MVAGTAERAHCDQQGGGSMSGAQRSLSSQRALGKSGLLNE